MILSMKFGKCMTDHHVADLLHSKWSTCSKIIGNKNLCDSKPFQFPRMLSHFVVTSHSTCNHLLIKPKSSWILTINILDMVDHVEQNGLSTEIMCHAFPKVQGKNFYVLQVLSAFFWNPYIQTEKLSCKKKAFIYEAQYKPEEANTTFQNIKLLNWTY